MRDQLADALDVEADERVAREDALLDIDGQEPAGIVAAEAQGGLGEVVGAEAEELGLLGDLAGAQGGAGQLDHRADQIVDAAALLGEHRRGGAVDQLLDDLQLGPGRDQRHHHFGNRRLAVRRASAASKMARACIS